MDVNQMQNLPIDFNWVSKVPQFLVEGARADRMVPVAEDYDVYEGGAVLRVDQFGFFLYWKADGRIAASIVTEPRLNVFRWVSDSQQKVHSNIVTDFTSQRKIPRELQSIYQFYQLQYEQHGEVYAPMRAERRLVPG